MLVMTCVDADIFSSDKSLIPGLNEKITTACENV